MTTIGVSGCMFLLVPAHPGCPEQSTESRQTPGGKKGDYQNCSVLYCVLKLCTVISTLR